MEESPSSQETSSEPSESQSTGQEDMLSNQLTNEWLDQDSFTKPWLMCEVDDMLRQAHMANLQQAVDLTGTTLTV